MLKRMLFLLSFLILLQAGGSGLSAGVLKRPYPAPEWAVSRWLNGDPGTLEENRDRVILIDFFQLWCPGCNRFSIPLFREWEEKYGNRDDILIVSIHTVFEGHASQTPHRLDGFIREKKIHHPVGIDAYPDDSAEVPITMKRYRTGGTPNVTIIDKQGQVRFHHLGSFDPAPVEVLIYRLLAEPGADGENTPPKRDLILSGEYRVRFHQKSKSCGATIEDREISMQLEAFHDRAVAKFPDTFLDLESIEVGIDPDGSGFHGRIETEVNLGPVPARLILEIWGRIFRDGERPEFDFDIQVRKLGDDPAWDCEITAGGRGNKTNPLE